jgi:5-methylcytosine-specific restriction endonuclease McrA
MRRSYDMYRDLRKRTDEKKLPFEVEELREMIRRTIDNKFCPYFGRFDGTVTTKNFSVDHRIPTSREGTNELSNLIVCCRSANLAKGALTDEEFEKVLDVLESLPEIARNDVLGRLKAGAAVVRLQFLGGKKK